MQLSSAELRDYALDALDPAKGHAPAALADTHARQVEIADDADAVFLAFEKTVKRLARGNPKSVEFKTSGTVYCSEAVTAACAADGGDKPAPSPGVPAGESTRFRGDDRRTRRANQGLKTVRHVRRRPESSGTAPDAHEEQEWPTRAADAG